MRDDRLAGSLTQLLPVEVDATHPRLRAERHEPRTRQQPPFALAQPVAMDLRLLMAALAINSQLERIGDIAVNIAERVESLAPYREFMLATRLSEMANIARIMVRDSLDAFIHGDGALAQRVLDSDDVVDKLDGGLFRRSRRLTVKPSRSNRSPIVLADGHRVRGAHRSR